MICLNPCSSPNLTGSVFYRNLKNSGKGAKGERIKNLGKGSISCRGQDNLETESVQPSSPPGEWLNHDDFLHTCIVYNTNDYTTVYHLTLLPDKYSSSIIVSRKIQLSSK